MMAKVPLTGHSGSLHLMSHIASGHLTAFDVTRLKRVDDLLKLGHSKPVIAHYLKAWESGLFPSFESCLINLVLNQAEIIEDYESRLIAEAMKRGVPAWVGIDPAAGAAGAGSGGGAGIPCEDISITFLKILRCKDCGTDAGDGYDHCIACGGKKLEWVDEKLPAGTRATG